METKKTPKEMAQAVFCIRAQRQVEQSLTNKCRSNEEYITELEALLKEHNISLPQRKVLIQHAKNDPAILGRLLKEGKVEEYQALLDEIKKYFRTFRTYIGYRDLGIWTMLPKAEIPTVGGALYHCFCGKGALNRVDILKGLSGRIVPGKLTLLLGPPGSGLLLCD